MKASNNVRLSFVERQHHLFRCHVNTQCSPSTVPLCMISGASCVLHINIISPSIEPQFQQINSFITKSSQSSKKMSPIKPSRSHTNFIKSLDRHRYPEGDAVIDDRCAICWLDQNSTTEEEWRCTGPPIKMPCCSVILGKPCILQALQEKTGRCPACRQRIYELTPLDRFARKYGIIWSLLISLELWTQIFRNMWAVYKVGLSLSCYGNMTIRFGLLLLATMFEIGTICFLLIPVDDGFLMQFINEKRGPWERRIAQAYSDLPKELSIPIMALVQLGVLRLGRDASFQYLAASRGC